KEINQPNTDEINRHKQTVLDTLSSEFGVEDLHGGGSRSRHTYVSGLSDIDLLLDLGSYSTSTMPDKDDPKSVLDQMAKRLQRRLPDTSIRAGRMAVTVSFSDGHELQILPAFGYHSGYRVPDPQGSGWVITRPRVFARLLAERNAGTSGMLLPTIKLAKRICANAQVDIKSYHLENMAVRAFESYRGPRSQQGMLRHLFNEAKSLTMRRMLDVTGQEEYVDRYLEAGNSRAALARQLSLIERRITGADNNPQQWRAILGRSD
ncbi:MAG: hypothetical protein M3P51_02510, partial [Chloroflexota bacterium]|nr:hypothetical protein [Chloroflexota bacterium]